MMSTFAVMLPALILMCGLSLDLGMMELRQMRMQTAADDAALSAAFEVEHNTWNWVSLGQAEASSYGYTNGANNVTVTVTMGPNYGAYQGRMDAMQVTIQQRVRTLFMGALNGGYVTVQAQSVAFVTPCMYLLGTKKLALSTYQSTSGALNSYNICPVALNGTLEVDAPSHVDVEAVNLYGTSPTVTGGGLVTPTPYVGSTTLADPLAYVTAPSATGSCTSTSYSATNATVTLNPGTYCKGLTLTNSTVTLNPGLYVITGGANWTNSTVTGNGVTLYFTSGGGASYGQFQMNFSTVSLTAPTSSSNGALAGFVVFADRNWVATQAQDFRIYFSSMSGDGIWYMPTAGFYIWNANPSIYVEGTVTGPHYFGIVADNLFEEGSNLNPRGDYSYVSGGNPFRTQEALVQ
jgi:hypothetical protein